MTYSIYVRRLYFVFSLILYGTNYVTWIIELSQNCVDSHQFFLIDQCYHHFMVDKSEES